MVFIAIGLFVFHHLEQLTSHPIRLRWEFVVYALVFTLLGHMCSYLIWRLIAASFDMRSTWSHAGKAWFVSRLGRYVPGKISLLLLRFNAYGEQSKTKVSAATLIEAYTALGAASLLVIYFLATNAASAGPSLVAVGALLLLLLALSHPFTIQFALGLVRCFIAVPHLSALPSYRQILTFVIGQLLTLFLHGAALFMAFNAVGRVLADHYLLITAAYFVAGLAGTLAVFAPSGIGVREAALLALLTQYLDPATLIVGVILIRLVVIASELSLSAFFVFFERPSRRSLRRSNVAPPQPSSSAIKGQESDGSH